MSQFIGKMMAEVTTLPGQSTMDIGKRQCFRRNNFIYICSLHGAGCSLLVRLYHIGVVRCEPIVLLCDYGQYCDHYAFMKVPNSPYCNIDMSDKARFFLSLPSK
uniref:Ovule protein n=1 Tax=Ascaris lumbricoides TaxID=6252 RepID=A0A0M3I684_ASCLU